MKPKYLVLSSHDERYDFNFELVFPTIQMSLLKMNGIVLKKILR